MKYVFFTALKVFLIVVCLANVGFCQTRKKATVAAPTLKDDMALMLSWFKGEFDNFQQVYKEKEDKIAEPHEHIHSIFTPVTLPAFGQNVFYVMQYMDGDPKKASICAGFRRDLPALNRE